MRRTYPARGRGMICRMDETAREYALALDDADPLAGFAAEFVPAPGVLYLDGNSLGRLPRSTGGRVAEVVADEWGGGLVRSWSTWISLARRIGDLIGTSLLGARPGEVVVADSTSVNLYKLAWAAVSARPGRSVVLSTPDEFPTDRYVLQGLCAARGLTLRDLPADIDAGVSTESVVEALDRSVAVVVLSHVAYRSGALLDLPAITAAAHEAGALVLWDLSHSGGSVPVGLAAAAADLAVGCTYKYLNGGPGSPAFGYVNARLIPQLAQPIQGWMGASDVFLMGLEYVPADSIRRFLSGTPPIVGMLAMRDTVAMIEEAGIAAVRAKSVALTEFAVALADEWLTPLGVTLASPRDPERRGGHITLSHPAMREVTALLWQRDVIPDYRDPDGLRVGLSPLSTSFEEVCAGMAAVRDALGELTHD